MAKFETQSGVNMNFLAYEHLLPADFQSPSDPFVSYSNSNIYYSYGNVDEGVDFNFYGNFDYDIDPGTFEVLDVTGTVTSLSWIDFYHDYEVDPPEYYFRNWEIEDINVSVDDFQALTNQQLSELIFAGDDDIRGADAIDYLLGFAGDDLIKAYDGNDTLDGGTGEDIMLGGAGDDTYWVDNLHDVAVEYAGDGADRVFSSVNYQLGLNVENLTLTGTSALYGRGNDLANWITGTNQNDVLEGEGGNDTLYGGGGADGMSGGAGNDLFYADNAADQTFELAGQGTDTVAVNVSYALIAGSAIEVLRTTAMGATLAIDLTGNVLKQTITGNAGSNVLHDGGVGAADTLRGLGGDDTYRVYNAGDTIAEAAGEGSYDVVMAAVDYTLTAGAYVERLATNGTAGTSGIDLTGNERNQEVVGNSGVNILDGKAGSDVVKGLGGNDTLTGGTGSDIFVFNSTLNAATNVDDITDFSVAADTIQLENTYFAALATTGTLAAAAFRANTTGLAQDASDRIIYETDTGELYYDANGNAAGGGILFAVITAGLGVTNADFVVI